MKYVPVVFRRFVLLLSSAILLCIWTTGTASASPKYIHLFVALADNQNQGIVPVPPKLGNGEDPGNNLYWGALYGVKTWFRRSPNWELLESIQNPGPDVLERCVFKYKKGNIYLVADAYRGSRIKKAITDFLLAAVGHHEKKQANQINTVRLNKAPDFVCYVGHNGLMDFSIDIKKISPKTPGRDAMVLACLSKPYFLAWLKKLGAKPVLLTNGLLAPEAYTVEAVLNGWIQGLRGTELKNMAAAAYHKYQHCGIKSARNLFFSVE